MNKNQITKHIESLSPEARAEIAAGQWDEVTADALYTACGAGTSEEMSEARRVAEGITCMCAKLSHDQSAEDNRAAFVARLGEAGWTAEEAGKEYDNIQGDTEGGL